MAFTLLANAERYVGLSTDSKPNSANNGVDNGKVVHASRCENCGKLMGKKLWK